MFYYTEYLYFIIPIFEFNVLKSPFHFIIKTLTCYQSRDEYLKNNVFQF